MMVSYSKGLCLCPAAVHVVSWSRRQSIPFPGGRCIGHFGPFSQALKLVKEMHFPIIAVQAAPGFEDEVHARHDEKPDADDGTEDGQRLKVLSRHRINCDHHARRRERAKSHVKHGDGDRGPAAPPVQVAEFIDGVLPPMLGKIELLKLAILAPDDDGADAIDNSADPIGRRDQE
jgi:hypothetical protein